MKPTIYSFSILLILLLGGCESCVKKNTPRVIAGKTTIFVADPYNKILTEEVKLFTSLYPDAHITLHTTSTEEAIVSFLNDSVKIIFVDRPFTDEENQIIQQYSIPVSSTIVARDGLTIIAHSYNPIRQISQQSLKKIILGTETNWRNIPESRWGGSIQLALTNKHSGIYRLLQQNFFPTQTEFPISAALSCQEELVQFVTQHPQSIGVISFTTAQQLPKEIKVLPVEATLPDSTQGFLKPTQENIYQQLYPFHYSLYLYSREAKGGLGLGFGTFLLTYSGQKIIQDAGIAPVNIPSRPIQITVE
jgi:phosphate transport system substrate-binding protein